ncbi:Crossover junction endonuclease mus81 [Microbotryomycetes sp. JL201]|nr:Crossover junction endonuclease mus81 [Microbotryomycetes sp. JL201]
MAPRVQPGNPLWLEWIEDQQRVCEEKGTEARHHWAKAASSFRKCPKTFLHPSEAIELHGIGKSTVDFLCRKLKAHCQLTGEPFPDQVGIAPARAATKKRTVAQAVTYDDEEDPERAARRRRLLGLPDPDETVITDAVAAAPAATKPKKQRTYIPAKGSGPYAILIGLYKLSSADEMYMPVLKTDLVQVAQEYATSSFAKSSDGGFHTAWSSMSTLVTKGLVTADNRKPKRWALTEAGFKLAEQIAPTAGVAVHSPSQQRARAGPSNEEFRPRLPAYVTASTSANRPQQNVEDPDVDRQLELALELSRRESTGTSFDNGPTSTGAASFARARLFAEARRAAVPVARPMDRGLEMLSGSSSPFRSTEFGSNRPALDGRKAASGYYAAHSARPTAAPPSGNVDTIFGFYYLDPHDNRSLSKEKAEFTMEDGTLERLYRIEYRVAQDLHQMANAIFRKAVLSRREPLPGGKTMSGYLRARTAMDKATGFPSGAPSTNSADEGKGKQTDAPVEPRPDPFNSLMAGYKAPAPKRSKQAMYVLPTEVAQQKSQAARAADSLADGPSCRTKSTSAFSLGSSSPLPIPVRAQTTIDLTSGQAPDAPSSVADPARSLPASASRNVCPSFGTASASFRSGTAIPVAFANSPVDIVVNRHPLDPAQDNVSATDYQPPQFEPRLLRPGTFKIVLIVDTREKGRSAEQDFVRMLENEGLDVDRKMLTLGDMIWVARPVDEFGNPNGQDDVVLNAIVERKRLDDLCKSILDNRYMTQKIRMRDSGITHRTYLIEEYDSYAQYKQWGKQIWTAKAQLQVVDGFFLHESKSFNDSVKWLKRRTVILKKMHENTTLYVIPNAMIDRKTYLPLQAHLHKTQPSTQYLTTYSMFDQLNKSDSGLTVKTQWANMIQKINGVSAEKAVQFVDKWPTPYSFYLATKRHRQQFEAHPSQNNDVGRKCKQRKIEDFVVDSLPDIGQRGIKSKVGARIWHLFASKEYEPGQI